MLISPLSLTRCYRQSELMDEEDADKEVDYSSMTPEELDERLRNDPLDHLRLNIFDSKVDLRDLNNN